MTWINFNNILKIKERALDELNNAELRELVISLFLELDASNKNIVKTVLFPEHKR